MFSSQTCTLFTHAGAGKTYTMTGGRRDYKQRGLIPRTIASLLAELRAAPGLVSWRVSISYVEIYNEQVYDLLDITTQPHEISLYEDAYGRLQFPGVKKKAASTEQEALALFFEVRQHSHDRQAVNIDCLPVFYTRCLHVISAEPATNHCQVLLLMLVLLY